jgi:hypothetical protein
LFAQGIYERIPNTAERLSVLLLGYNEKGIVGFGSASLFLAPATTNQDSTYFVCAITALHNLKNHETGKPIDGVLLKLNMPNGSKPRYVKVPLKNDEPKNYWVSPSGLDLAAIPLPPDTLTGSDAAYLRESQIVTPSMVDIENIRPGLVVQVLCMQPEYYMAYPSDFLLPATTATIRMGHLSRIGFIKDMSSIQVRPHVIDVHSSPGNSGASVIVYVPRNDASVADLMFLCIIQGFREEAGSYVPYQIPLAQAQDAQASIEFVSAQGATNRMVLAIKTVANPNLTEVIPVHELVSLRDSKEFQAALTFLVTNKTKYEFLTTPSIPSPVTK